ncbi:MAG: DUF4194 domain-containing protein [Corynebacterium glucuronolyticum]|nr:DUF4194 domain-containing protein [Corynebacterium glucuronolyticum]MDD7587259.1 DUF4194 domain-containing protein [Mycobacteriaceae bacterium]MDY5834678.1 DUF4194 domain-containing protein [Corynebacterium glucuronolyticum]
MDETTQLTDTDTGTLTLKQRQALVKLIKGPFVTASDPKDQEIFNVIVESREVLSQQLNNLFLTLVLDETAGIAYTKVWDAEVDGARSLLRARPLTFLDTVVILHLRRQLAKASPNERTIVDKQEVFEATAPYQATQGTDHTKQQTNFNASWKRIAEWKVVAQTLNPDRWEVSQVLRVAFSSEEIKAVTESFEKLLEDTDE